MRCVSGQFPKLSNMARVSFHFPVIGLYSVSMALDIQNDTGTAVRRWHSGYVVTVVGDSL